MDIDKARLTDMMVAGDKPPVKREVTDALSALEPALNIRETKPSDRGTLVFVLLHVIISCRASCVVAIANAKLCPEGEVSSLPLWVFDSEALYCTFPSASRSLCISTLHPCYSLPA